MKIYLFRSTSSSDVFGFTADETGNNLPADLGAWTQAQTGGMLSTGDAQSVGASAPVVTAIEQAGFYVARSETIAHLTGIPWVE